ncbi:MAG: DUF58 domain-containing protein [Planctomyces sp.]|nr:DUF58 domain-containing protein [Planctomyces sp.]
MLFPADFLKRVEYLSIISKRVFQGTLLAQRRSRQTGTGVEFADHREYVAGDDLRYLDWNVYARHGSLLIKRFQAETDLRIFILLDCSGSMQTGSPSKFDLARQLAAALSYIALSDLDRVSIIPFADTAFREFPLTRGKARIVPVMNFLSQLSATGNRTQLRSAVDFLLTRHAEQGLVILISDFFDDTGFEHSLDLLRCSPMETNVVQIYAAEEANPEVTGDVELVDSETGATRRIRVTENTRSEYLRRFHAHLSSLAAYCVRHRISCVQASSDSRYDELIVNMMKTAGVAP